MSRLAFGVLLALPLAACGGRVDLPGEENDSGTPADTAVASDTAGSVADAAPSDGSTPPSKTCVRARDCGSESMFCSVPVGACGAGGICVPKPTGCDLLYAPVCGCDGKAYGNECAAQLAGATVAGRGECDSPPPPPPGGCGAGCAKSDYCKYPDGMCGGAGTCTKYPMGCPDIFKPVCGCDGRTYGNSCDAAQVAQSVAYAGTCED